MSDGVVWSPLGQWLRGRVEAFRDHSRGVGSFLLVVGWAGAYWTDRVVVHAAQLRASVGALPAAFVVLVTGAVLGLICVIGGRGAVDTLCRRGLGRVRHAAFIAVGLVLPAFLAFMWMLHVLDDVYS